MKQPALIYLASRSPRRRELLRQIGLAFEVVLLREGLLRGLDVDETPRAGESAEVYVQRVIREKAEAAANMVRARRLAQYPILAADTSVVCDGQILGKPSDAVDAIRMLELMSGRAHRVVTGVAVARGDQIDMRISDSAVWFCQLDATMIRRYVASGEPFDKAGAYAIQGRAATFITRIEGSYSGIMGLPLAETAELLRSHDILLP